MKFSFLSSHPTHGTLIPFCSSPRMCLKTVTHLPPPLSADRMISCILFQLGISKELSFCKFCGKEELNKGKRRELVLLQKDIYTEFKCSLFWGIMLAHSVSGCPVLQTDRKGWELESLGDVTGGRKERGCWNKDNLGENKCWDWSE